MPSRGRVISVVALSLAGLALAYLLLLQHHGESSGAHAVAAVCGEGGGCDQVNASSYSQLAGVPLAGFGLLFYASMLALLGIAAVADDDTRAAAAVVALAGFALALAIDVVLFAVQAFAIHAYCKLCLATYAVNAASIALLAPARAWAPRVRAGLQSPLGRLLVAGWLAATVLAGAAVAAGEAGLRAREAQRQAQLLGVPTAGPAPTTTMTPATLAPQQPGESNDDAVARYKDAAQKAEDRAKRLQDTLDDPVKLSQYQDAKASRDFDEAKVQKVDLSNAPSKGAANGPITVVEYSDFLCPWCRNLAMAFANYLPQSGNRVTIYFKEYPLDQSCNANIHASVHSGSCWMALGGICAQEQSKFWTYHDKVFSGPPENPHRDDVLRIATEIGLNVPAFEACLAAPKTTERLKADIAEGKQIDVTGTPTLLINGKKLPRLNDFLQAIEKESKRLGLPPLPPPQG